MRDRAFWIGAIADDQCDALLRASRSGKQETRRRDRGEADEKSAEHGYPQWNSESNFGRDCSGLRAGKLRATNSFVHPAFIGGAQGRLAAAAAASRTAKAGSARQP